MSDRMGSDPDSRGGAELFEAVQARLLSSDERSRTAAFRGAEIDQPVQIVVAAGQAEDRSAITGSVGTESGS